MSAFVVVWTDRSHLEETLAVSSPLPPAQPERPPSWSDLRGPRFRGIAGQLPTIAIGCGSSVGRSWSWHPAACCRSLLVSLFNWEIHSLGLHLCIVDVGALVLSGRSLALLPRTGFLTQMLPPMLLLISWLEIQAKVVRLVIASSNRVVDYQSWVFAFLNASSISHLHIAVEFAEGSLLTLPATHLRIEIHSS